MGAAATPSAERNRLRWHCRRGMLELDLLLEGFLDDGYDRLDVAGRERFARLLDYPDQVLIDWFMGNSVPSDGATRDLVARIRGEPLPAQGPAA
jgi:antitoxin CptB